MDSLVKQTEEENRKLQEELNKIKNDDHAFGDLADRANDDVEALKRQYSFYQMEHLMENLSQRISFLGKMILDPKI